MIRRPTVFVLGAGASKPCGFPLGGELVDLVLRLLPPECETPYTQAVQEAAEVGPDAIRAFLRDLRDARRSSVDRFLQTRPGYARIGKAAIAGILIPSENDDLLAERSDWLTYLLDHMIRDEDPESFRLNKLTVLTFNFDRSFERALFLALRASYGLEDRYAAELASHVTVHHIHGDLGWPSWMPPSGVGPAWSRDYTPTFDWHHLSSAAHRIRLMHEEVTDDHRLEPLLEALRGAQHICLLGCGLHVPNLARLRLNERLPLATLHATCMETTIVERNPAVSFCGGNKLELYDMDVAKFLRSIDLVHE